MSLALPERWDLPHGQVWARRSGPAGRQSRPSRAGPNRVARPAAVLVHGLGGSSLNWIDLMTVLGEDVDLLAVDLPGFGQSPPPRDGDYSPAGHARVVAALIRSWQEQRGSSAPVHVFGNSLGGAVGLQLAARFPDLAASLTLIAPALPRRLPSRGNVHLPVVALPGLGESLATRYGRAPAEQRVQATLNACFADPAAVSSEVRQAIIDEVVARDRLPYADDAVLSSLRGLLAGFLDPSADRPWALARRTRCPVLAIYGEGDILVHPRAAQRAARAFPDVEVVLLSECGHVAQMEHPQLVAELWRETILDRTTGALASP